MNKLPQEIIDHIASWLPEPDTVYRRFETPSSSIRPRIASVSEKFRHAIERFTFYELHIKTSDSGLSTFSEMLSGARTYRRRFLTRLHVTVLLPEYADHKYPTFEFETERQANNQAASRGIHELVYILSGWDGSFRLRLELKAQFPSDAGALTMKQLRQRYDEIIDKDHPRHSFGHEEFMYSMTEIAGVDKMPFVPCVSTIQFHGDDTGRQFSPKAALALATRFLQVQTFETEWNEPYWFPDLLQAMRRQVMDSLISTRLPPTLDTLVFKLDPPNRISGNLATSPNLQPDRLLRVLHYAVNHVAHFSFSGEVDPSLFWPYRPSETPRPFWQSMKKLEIRMEQNSTSSEWYQRTKYNKWSQKTIARYSNIVFPVNHAGLPAPGHGSVQQARSADSYVQDMIRLDDEIFRLTDRILVDGGFGDDDEDDGSDDDDGEDSSDTDESKYEYDDARADEMLEFIEVNEPAMARLLDALMKAMLQMRSLEFVKLKGYADEMMWSFQFYAPGVRSRYDAKSKPTPSHPRLFLPRLHFWAPGEEIMNGFRKMALEKYGQQLAIVWDKSQSLR